MAYFPFFVEMEGQHGLVAGGGTVALRKVEKLLPYGAQLTIVAPKVCKELQKLAGQGALQIRQETVRPEMVDDYDFVVAATDAPEINHVLAARCREQKIPVNVVDDKEYCSFLFPSLVQSGALSVGISTGGASPTAAVWLRKQIEQLLPDSLPEILLWLEQLRPTIFRILPTESRRAKAYATLLESALKKGRPLNDTEMILLLFPKWEMR